MPVRHPEFKVPVRIAILLVLALPVRADEGIWLFNQAPIKLIQERHGIALSEEFLDKLRLSSVKTLASGSFVSPRGLIFTNHHVASECIQQLSSAGHDYMANGFWAASEADERKCPDLEANVLLSIEDVTDRVNAEIAPAAPAAETNRLQKANSARIEKECGVAAGNLCAVVKLYSGGQHHLYRYKKYDDVRLVWRRPGQLHVPAVLPGHHLPASV